MTTPSEALAGLTRPIIGIENRTAQEVFDIMCGRIEHSTALRSAPVPSALSEEEVARRLALAGLAADRVRETPPHWEEKDWQKRVLECIPGRDEAHCREVARALLTPAETAPHPVCGDGSVERLKRHTEDVILVIGTDDDDDVRMFRDAAAEIERLRAEVAGLEQQLAIADMPACFSCGRKVTEECPRSAGHACGREFHGGTRAPIRALKENDR